MDLIKSKLKERKLFAFDIETEGQKNNFVMGSIYSDNMQRTFWSKEDFINFISKNNKYFEKSYIVATNLGFDITALLSGTKEMKNFIPLVNNSRIISAKIVHKNKHIVKFIDTLNFAPFSVEKWGNLLGIPKLKKPDFLGKIPETFEQKRELEAYNMNDSKITYHAIKFLQNNFLNLGTNMKITIASTAMELFRRKYLKEKWFQPNRVLLDYLFKGYYGGRCEALKRGSIKNLNYYDFNSLYPSVMRNEYPKPNKFFYTTNMGNYELEHYDGVAEVSVITPYRYVPYLPFRTKDKLIFPVGKFKGHYTFFELRRALELGYVIEKFHSAVIYKEKFTPFKNYVEDLYSKRKEMLEKNDSREIIYKLLLNSLYGKFAQKIKSKEIIMPESQVTYEMLEKAKDINEVGNFFIFKKEYDYIPSFVNPIMSIYTTAYARDKLFDEIMKSPKDVFYYDTDSLITNCEYKNSYELGELKLEKFIKEGIIIKPKFYIFNNIPKCKGANKITEKGFYDILRGEKFTYEKFTKFKESIRRHFGFNEIINVDKVFSLEDNKRIWENDFNPSENQDSRAIIIKEGVTEIKYRSDFEKAERDRQKNKIKEEEIIFNSDLFDKFSVGKDIFYKEFLENEKFFARNE